VLTHELKRFQSLIDLIPDDFAGEPASSPANQCIRGDLYPPVKTKIQAI